MGAAAMSTLFAFSTCAFTLVSAIAIEFALIRQELTLSRGGYHFKSLFRGARQRGPGISSL
jgi:hypothetical protein